MPFTFFANPNKDIAHLQSEAKRLYASINNLISEKVNHVNAHGNLENTSSFRLTYPFTNSFRQVISSIMNEPSSQISGKSTLFINKPLLKKYEQFAAHLDRLWAQLPENRRDDIVSMECSVQHTSNPLKL